MNWPVRRIHAGEIEWVVIEQIRVLLTTPEVIFGHLASVLRGSRTAASQKRRSGKPCAALRSFGPLWDELFPAEQPRIGGILMERVDVTGESASIRLRAEGLRSLVR